jgi:hypothetical protein
MLFTFERHIWHILGHTSFTIESELETFADTSDDFPEMMQNREDEN